MDVIILAGGLGTRLREVVADVPKPLALVNGKPFLDILLNQLNSLPDIGNIILSVGYKKEAFKTRYPDFIFSEEENPLGTGGALKQALTYAKTADVWVLNGDSYFGIDFSAMWTHHRKEASDITLACRHIENTSRYGAVAFNKEKRVTRFIEKEASAAPGWINGGIYLMKKNLLIDLPSGFFSLEQEGFPKLLQKRCFAYPAEGIFIDIGTKESYFQVQELFK